MSSYEHEHVTPYIYEHGKVYYCELDCNYGKYRLTLDTAEDWQLVNAVASKLDSVRCSLGDIIGVLEENPDFYELNRNVKQRS